MSAVEKTYPTCLPPEAYIKIAKTCENNTPRFKSSYYPTPKTKKTK
jgi:hypothetical protein